VFPDCDIEYPTAEVQSYVANIPAEHSFSVEPFVPSGGEWAHEDAADYMIKILEICSTQLRHGRKVFGEGHGPYMPSCPRCVSEKIGLMCSTEPKPRISAH
jgi:hypothetical protein